MQESILVGVTDSPASRRALEWAVARARERLCRIELLSVVGGPIGAVGEGAVVDQAIMLTRTMLDRDAARIRATGIAVETRISRGNPVEELINASTIFDLLVIGSDYRGPKAGTRRGPHGIRVAAGAHCPVAVVPDVDLTGRRGVVVGVDGSATSEHAIEFAAAEADRAGDSLTAVTTWSPVPLPLDMRSYPMEYLSSMKSLAEETLAISLAGLASKYPDLVVRSVVERGDPEATINHLGATASMVVVGSHGRGLIGRFLLGSTSREVLARPVTVTVVLR